MKRALIPIALLATGLPVAAAFAHAFLDHAVPAVGGTVTAAPKEVQIFYTQALEPAFSGATLARCRRPARSPREPPPSTRKIRWSWS